ncbi:lysosomal cystine transporter [Lineolata rhizophorae]|uniref:Lysosomal cystine transporter n=1 Tax=Lineolata rhizophorae TaxID=578093 RepID=A0A6A6PBQ1_9PEZI|nr:lysosomal cystine transporter [Lineolata rhizophorae]
MSYTFLKALSWICGWTYTICWSASFWPQPWLNHKRRSTVGVSIDFPMLNLFGFVSYTIYTAAFLFSPEIRREYGERYPESPEPTVTWNDFAFAAHGAVCCVIVYTQFWPQIWGYTVGNDQSSTSWARGIFAGGVLTVAALIFAVVATEDTNEAGNLRGWAWLDVMYAFSVIKMIVTLVKYFPQAVENYQRKSTVGWSIYQINLDLSGGVLSMLQLGIDAYLQGSVSGVVGNPIKLALALISIVYDVIFIAQHYWWYASARHEKYDEEAGGEVSEDGGAPDGDDGTGAKAAGNGRAQGREPGETTSLLGN